MFALVLAAMISCGDLCRHEAKLHYADLLKLAGYGRWDVEQAGFLIRESDGTLTLAPWGRGAYHRAAYFGSIPRGTIAIVHTHPRTLPRPSSADVREARRLGIPIVVVTARAITVARAEGGIAILFEGEWSFRSAVAKPPL